MSQKSQKSSKRLSQKSSKSRVETTQSTANSKSGGKKMDPLLATMYFLDWNTSILESYTKCINQFYVVPLTEHCVRKKVKFDQSSSISNNSKTAKAIATGRKLEAGIKVEQGQDDVKQLQRRLMDAQTEVGNGDDEYVPVRRERWTSLAEMSVMFRLRTLVQMCGSLLIFMEKIRSWVEKNRKHLGEYARQCKDVLEYAVVCFEAVCCQADIFGLDPVERSKVRSDCRHFVSTSDPYKNTSRKRNQLLQLKGHVKEQIKALEGQVNYYRASVHLIGNSLTDITQAILQKIPREMLEVTTKEVKAIMDRLPPAYHFPGKCPLTEGTQKLLANHPPNRRRLVRAAPDVKSAKSDRASSLATSRATPHSAKSSKKSKKSKRSPKT